MTKYIYIILLVGVCSLRLDAQHPIGEAKIDSIYHTLSLEEKVRSLLVRPMIEPWTEEPDSIPKWVNMEKLLISEGKRPLMLSDMMIRSALLRGNNRDVRDRFINLLLRKRLDGAYFPMQSPYTLLFQDVDSQPIDLFLNPIGRLVVPYVDEGAGNRVFMTNLYKLPKDILSQQQLLLKERSLSSSTQHFIKGAGWRGVADVKGLSEEPTLDMLLKHGGLIYSDDAEKDFKILLRVFENRVLPQQLLEQSCKKRLLLESLLSHKPKPMVYGALNEEIDNLVRQLYEKGAVLLENKGVLPLRELEKRSVVSIHIGTDKESVFQQTLSKYCSVNHYDIEGVPDVAHVAKLRKSIAGFNTVIVGVNGDWFEDAMNASLYSFLHQISSSAELILVHFGSGNRLKDLPVGHPFKAILLSYDMNSTAQEIAAQIIFGGVGAQGILARNIDKRFAFGCGELTHKSRLGFAPSYSVAMSDTLKLIDQEVYKAIRERAIPGCQVLVAKDGDVIYNKAFGYHTYNKKTSC
ncbi:hypothetical protein [Saccharicrinis fermentans]|uniref:Uncharacterized protein n=1 Tax=Saccharicrinis fermentans DSM 9555 = JCM 21142 TaxID=869213 RepID=W7YCN2_9BACT|nr:hypothetical protein [Saccharicrinis fermentans]GAF05228.1 hypothetical protein JCM21142_93955 [Saccharicrinis fermentans DSM 9555 = JCM 21142]